MELIDVCEKDLVSVVITTYNSASTIQDVLDALLQQQYPLDLVEVIVVDGHSHDNTLNIIEKFKNEYGKRFRDFKTIKHEQNFGVSRARNDGIKVSRGEYIMILDSDVILPPNAIKEMVKFLSLNPNVGCCVLLHKPDTSSVILRWHYEVDYGKNRYTIAATSAAMLRRGILKKIGLYNETMGPPFSVDEDLEFGARIWKAGYKVIKLGNVIAYHLMEKRDRYIMCLKGKNEQEGKISFTVLTKWSMGYFKDKNELTWYMFLRALPLRIKLRYVFHSAFLPSVLMLMLSSIFGVMLLIHVCYILVLTIFLDALRDFYDFSQIHKSCVLTLLACVNRSSRNLSIVFYFIKLATKKCIPL